LIFTYINFLEQITNGFKCHKINKMNYNSYKINKMNYKPIKKIINKKKVFLVKIK